MYFIQNCFISLQNKANSYMIIQLAIVCQKTLKRPKTYMKNEYGKYCPG